MKEEEEGGNGFGFGHRCEYCGVGERGLGSIRRIDERTERLRNKKPVFFSIFIIV